MNGAHIKVILQKKLVFKSTVEEAQLPCVSWVSLRLLGRRQVGRYDCESVTVT